MKDLVDCQVMMVDPGEKKGAADDCLKRCFRKDLYHIAKQSPADKAATVVCIMSGDCDFADTLDECGKAGIRNTLVVYKANNSRKVYFEQVCVGRRGGGHG